VKNVTIKRVVTVMAGVGAANGWNGRASSGNDELKNGNSLFRENNRIEVKYHHCLSGIIM
jgi:hypothetical protein